MDDQLLLRYSRQIMLPEIDVEGQERLRAARVLVVGLGGLGSPAALYLAAAGVGELVLADFDRVDLSNLQRQIIHDTSSVGRPKVDSAAERLLAINPDVRVRTVKEPVDEGQLPTLLNEVDLVLDGSDNFRTRQAVNTACVGAARPLVSGAVIRWEGQLAVFRPDRPEAGCYRCLFAEAEDPRETCSATGVIAPLPGIIGSLQALEALKLITGLPAEPRLQLFDALSGDWRSLRLRRDPHCPVCGQRA